MLISININKSECLFWLNNNSESSPRVYIHPGYGYLLCLHHHVSISCGEVIFKSNSRVVGYPIPILSVLN